MLCIHIWEKAVLADTISQVLFFTTASLMKEIIVLIHLILANSILIIHFAFILFAVFGGLLIFYRRWLLWLHIPVVFWAAFIEFSGRICPLTPMENYFRILAGQKGYDHGFIHHYLLKIIYHDGLTRQLQVFLGLGVLIFNLLVYAVCLKKIKRHRVK